MRTRGNGAGCFGELSGEVVAMPEKGGVRLSADTWERLNLRSTPLPFSPPHHRTPKYIQDFTNGRRTIHPSYQPSVLPPRPSTVQAFSKGGSLLDLVTKGYSRDEVGRAKAVLGKEGKVKYTNATSQANALYIGSPRKYRGKETALGEAEYSRPLSRKLTSTGILSRQSQIDTVPGPHRSSSSQVVKVKPSPLHQVSQPQQLFQPAAETVLVQRWTVETAGEDWVKSEGKRRNCIAGGVKEEGVQRVKPRPLVATNLFASSLKLV